jgi:hypothetical protein
MSREPGSLLLVEPCTPHRRALQQVLALLTGGTVEAVPESPSHAREPTMARMSEQAAAEQVIVLRLDDPMPTRGAISTWTGLSLLGDLIDADMMSGRFVLVARRTLEALRATETYVPSAAILSLMDHTYLQAPIRLGQLLQAIRGERP